MATPMKEDMLPATEPPPVGLRSERQWQAEDPELTERLAEPEGLRHGWGCEPVAAAMIGRAKGKIFWSKEASYRWLNRLVKKHPDWKRRTDEFGVEYNVREILNVKFGKGTR